MQQLAFGRGRAEYLAKERERRFRLQVEVDAAILQRGEKIALAARRRFPGGAEGFAEKRARLLETGVRRGDGVEPEAGIFVRKDHAHGKRKVACVNGDGLGERGIGGEPVLRELVGRFARKVAEQRRLRQQKHGGERQKRDGGVLQVG